MKILLNTLTTLPSTTANGKLYAKDAIAAAV